ncbi:hypothetical protein GCM10020367_29550 [Streptomyces sannanensis]|uniref:DUF461 domain-containing protein n=1 Tax=Streptomyces sannanensis TaxID=285536 RepID=A0ABP6SC34_9ACTN
MSRSLRRGALAATVLAFSLVTLSACAAGNDAQTLGVKPDNAAVKVGDIQVQNATLITQPEPGAAGPAVVSATLFNNGTAQQTLDTITLPGTSASVKLTAAGGSGAITVPAGGSVVLGGEGNASAVIENGSAAGANGSVQKVAFTFSKTGEVALNAFVVPATSYFTSFGPTPQAGATTATPTATATPATTATPPVEGAGSEASDDVSLDEDH